MKRRQMLGMVTFFAIALSVVLVIAAHQWESERKGALVTAASSSSASPDPSSAASGSTRQSPPVPESTDQSPAEPSAGG